MNENKNKNIKKLKIEEMIVKKEIIEFTKNINIKSINIKNVNIKNINIKNNNFK